MTYVNKKEPLKSKLENKESALRPTPQMHDKEGTRTRALDARRDVMRRDEIADM